MSTVETQQQTPDEGSDEGTKTLPTLTVTDNRTGTSYELPISDGTVRASDLRQIKVDPDEFGMMSYDPAFMNTASCRSSITYIDGDAGILQHRGYPIEQLCEHSSYLEVAYLLINGRLPTQTELDRLGGRDHNPHVRARERQGLHAGLPLRRQPDGHARRLGGGALDLLPGRQQDPRGARPRDPDHPSAREDADAGRLRLPPQHGPALRLPGQRALLCGELPRDDVQDDRAQIQARSSPGAGT